MILIHTVIKYRDMFILGFGGATAVIHVPKSGFLNFINYYPPFLGHAIKLHVVPFFKLGGVGKDPTSC